MSETVTPGNIMKSKQAKDKMHDIDFAESHIQIVQINSIMKLTFFDLKTMTLRNTIEPAALVNNLKELAAP